MVVSGSHDGMVGCINVRRQAEPRGRVDAAGDRGLQFWSAGIEEFASDGATEQNGSADGKRRHVRGAENRNDHGSDGHRRTRLADHRHVDEKADEDGAGHEQEPHFDEWLHEQANEMLVTARSPKDVGEAHRGSDRDQELLVSECGEEFTNDRIGLADQPAHGKCRREEDESYIPLASNRDDGENDDENASR